MRFQNIIFIFPILLFTIGCSHSNKISNNFCITLGTGGGFTGLYNGYYIDTLGNISTWEGRKFNIASGISVGKISTSDLQDLNFKIQEMKILNLQFRKSGNISSSISFVKENSVHTISWSGFEPDEQVPQVIRDFYFYIKNLINKSINKK